MLLFETLLPVRFYVPPDDVIAPLVASDTVTYCAYKGRASYLSLAGVRDDIVTRFMDDVTEQLRGMERMTAFACER